MQIKVKKLHPDAVIPQYATAGAAAFDLVTVEDVTIAPGETKKVPLGLAFEIPEGYVLYVCMRSGIALKTPLRQPNGIGVIDSDYRGEVSMLFENAAEIGPFGTYFISKGDRVAQGVIQEAPRVELVESDELSETKRGSGGFGHTGTKAILSNGGRGA
jgi:dUTP pyrophosphatase